MSHSDGEIKGDLNSRMRNVGFKAKTKFGNPETVRKLKYRLKPMYKEIRLVEAVTCNNTILVKSLLESGVSANSTDTDLRSALHVAVSRGYEEMVELLLSHGADPNKRDMIQNTPLHLAACIHNLKIITLLINANADVSCLDIHGRNPSQLASSKLQLLQKGWREGSIEMMRLRDELKQVVDLLLSIYVRGLEEKMEQLSHSDIDSLQMMKLSLNSDPPEVLDTQMSNLLNGIEKFKIT